mgnify:CR=1 FL=1|jgi:hypothetical protein
MGYVKLPKARIASGIPQFDVLPADNVGSVKLSGDTAKQIDVTYMGGDANTDTITIKPVVSSPAVAGDSFTQADIQALVEAIGLIGGGSGMINVMLSKTVLETVVGAS